MTGAIDEEWYWLREIANAAHASSPWLDLLGTFLATVAGGAIALVGTWYVFRRERAERYEVRLNEALGEVMHAGAAVIAANEEWLAKPFDPSASGSLAIVRSRRPAPSTEAFSMTISAAMLAAAGTDLEVLRNLRRAAWTASSKSARYNIAIVDDILQTITEWRAPMKNGGFDALATSTAIVAHREASERAAGPDAGK